jgi:hypothetical protein
VRGATVRTPVALDPVTPPALMGSDVRAAPES